MYLTGADSRAALGEQEPVGWWLQAEWARPVCGAARCDTRPLPGAHPLLRRHPPAGRARAAAGEGAWGSASSALPFQRGQATLFQARLYVFLHICLLKKSTARECSRDG